MFRTLPYLLVFFLLTSCFSPGAVMLRRQSNFADFDEMGIHKADFLQKYGKPLNKDLSEKEGIRTERLYYLEKIGGIYISTQFSFENDRLVKQKYYNPGQYFLSKEEAEEE